MGLGGKASGIFVGLLFAACGVQTSVTTARPLSMLNREEATQLCKDRETYRANFFGMTPRKTLVCNLAGQAAVVQTSTDKLQACNDAFDRCMGNGQPAASSFDCDLATVALGCTATVGEFNACLAATAEALLEYSTKNECERIAQNPKLYEPPSVCKSLQTTCPEAPLW